MIDVRDANEYSEGHIVDAINIPFDPQTYYSMIPPEVGQMLGAIGVTQAITIIVAALVIRFILQTVPFVRWGS